MSNNQGTQTQTGTETVTLPQGQGQGGQPVATVVTGVQPAQPKRGRGRPKGSKNKPKA